MDDFAQEKVTCTCVANEVRASEGQSMCRVLQTGATALVLRLTCRGQSRFELKMENLRIAG